MEFIGVCLITNDVPTLVKFYKKLLEAESVGDDVYTVLKTKEAMLSIYSRQAMKDYSPRFPVRETGFSSFVMAFRVNDLNAEYERIKKLGVTSLNPPGADPAGNMSFTFSDPDGNIIDVVPE